ncbi:MAG: extensin family protein, partial [Hyphomicrobiales bacterium]|nr:extensin family protein [Hyphomicrobiales bacterium]
RGRNREAGAKLSEHAFGNAVDITGLRFSNGIDWSVSPLEEDDESGAAQFQRTVREVSCGLFKTVLGPGSDGFHDNHFHFDLAQRRGGSTYCR